MHWDDSRGHLCFKIPHFYLLGSFKLLELLKSAAKVGALFLRLNFLMSHTRCQIKYAGSSSTRPPADLCSHSLHYSQMTSKAGHLMCAKAKLVTSNYIQSIRMSVLGLCKVMQLYAYKLFQGFFCIEAALF